MTHDALEQFIDETRSSWGPLTSELAAEARARLAELARTDPAEPWLAALLLDAPATRALHRDEQHGFVLLAHSESEGLYRRPHDHGRGWVVYAIVRGAIATMTYARVETDDGARLVAREQTVLRAGQSQLFLPGDIHDTRCVEGPALLLRFTAIDLEREAAELRLTRYTERDGRWAVGV